jgi:hypothetical protein
MNIRRAFSILAVAVGLVAVVSPSGSAQETPRPKDDALDSLLEKLSDPSDGPGKKDDRPTPSKKDADKPKDPGAGAKSAESRRPATGPAGDKPREKKPTDSAPLSGKDQEVDDLLQKLGETTETPSKDDRPRGGGGGDGEKTDAGGPSKKPGETDRSRLSGKDKETDEHLEELTGRKRRKKGDDGERSGPAGEIIKEMREIEQKLSKPDTGESTREEQKKVVKRIETLIEEAKQSGQSSMRRMVMRQVRQPGQQKGQQPGQTEGAMAQGVGPSKPATPTSKHSSAGGKDIWGHLPPELRAEIENMINEQPLASKEELIERYYLSVGKRKTVREESP